MKINKFPYQQDDHFRFAFVGDEWLVEYASQSSGVISHPAFVFSFVMTVELYVKAYFTKITGDGLAATKLGHHIKKILLEIENKDTRFPTCLKFNLALLDFPLFELDRYSWNTDWYNKLPSADQSDLKSNYEFYLIMAYGADLKYGISPSLQKHNGRIISSAWSNFNPKLAEIIITIRNLIEYPGEKTEDPLTYALHNPRLGEKSKEYLLNIISQTKYLNV